MKGVTCSTLLYYTQIIVEGMVEKGDVVMVDLTTAFDLVLTILLNN